MFSWLAFNTLCALPAALLLLAARRLLRTRPGLEHGLWLLVLLRLVAPPWPAASASTAATAGPGVSIVASGEPSLGDVLVARTTRLLGPNWSSTGERLLLVSFLAALAFVVLRELRRARAVERRVRRARPAPPGWLERVERVAARQGLRAPRVALCPEAPGPFVWSLRRPVLVLPAEEQAPTEAVLAHELAHLARRDHWSAWFELGVQALHFWNPLFWLARRRLHQAAELAADQRALQHYPAQRRVYASALVDALERAPRPVWVPRAVQAIGSDARDVEERLRLILTPRAGLGSPLARVALVLACGVVLAAPGWTGPRLEDFRAALPGIPPGADRTLRLEQLERARATLARDPSDGAAWGSLGRAALALERRDEALEAFRRQEALGHEPEKALYNQACTHALAGRPEAALECLERAAALGFPVGEYARADPDLVSLTSPAFAQRLGEL